MAQNFIKISESRNKKVSIFVDSKEANEILPFIHDDIKNQGIFYRFRELVINGNRNRDIYKKEDICKECKNLFAIRFMKGRNQNDRIYCLELHTAKKRNIFLAKLYLDKRVQKIDKRIISIIKPICTNDYGI